MFNNQVYNNYIESIDINNIEYISLNNDELMDFYLKNYYDSNNKLVAFSYNNDLNWNSPIGMYYLNFEKMPGMKYILGIVNNNIGKKTIVSCLVYCDEYKMFSNLSEYITYLSTVETNIYFRNMGLYYNLINNSFRFMNPNQHILISEISNMEKNCHVFDSFVKIFRSNGFLMDISNESDNFDINEYYKKIKKIDI